MLYLSTRIGVGLGWRGRVDFGDGLRDVYKLGEGGHSDANRLFEKAL